MRQPIIFKYQANKPSIFNQIFRWVIILFLVFSCFLIPEEFVSAKSRLENIPYQPYISYLPITVQASGTTYYVSTEGNNSNPGTYRHPWNTISHAASMVEPGDKVYIRGGIYHESPHFTTSGTASAQIQILAFPGEIPILDGENTIPGAGSALLWIVGDYIYVSGLEIRNSAYYGILVLGNYDTVDNVYVHHCISHGIVISQGYYSIVENSRVWRNSISNEYGQAANWGAGISAFQSGVSFATIRHNTVWENWGEGITSSVADHITIEGNITHDNFSANIYITDSTNVLCQRNFVYTDPTSYVFPYGSHSGIMMGDERYNPPSANITIINNISFGNQGNFWWWQGNQGGGMNNVLIANNTFVNGIGEFYLGRGGVIIDEGTHQNVRFENNLVKQDGNLPVISTMAQSDISYTHNLWSKTPYLAASGEGDIIADPLLAQIGDPSNADWFMLTSISPAINGAISLPDITMDYFWNIREQTPDMGAHEFFFP
jgi:hypothetical protein